MVPLLTLLCHFCSTIRLDAVFLIFGGGLKVSVFYAFSGCFRRYYNYNDATGLMYVPRALFCHDSHSPECRCCVLTDGQEERRILALFMSQPTGCKNRPYWPEDWLVPPQGVQLCHGLFLAPNLCSACGSEPHLPSTSGATTTTTRTLYAPSLGANYDRHEHRRWREANLQNEGLAQRRLEGGREGC